MFQKRLVIAVTPAGRRRYLQILAAHILACPTIDRWDLWVNTADEQDLAFMDGLVERNPGRVRLVHLPPGVSPNGGWTIHHFWPTAADPEAFYIRFDDDIVFFTPDTPEKLLRTLTHPWIKDVWMVSANIVNNAVCDFHHQQHGGIPAAPHRLTNLCMCDVGWKQPEVAEWKHQWFFQNLRSKMLHRYDWMRDDPHYFLIKHHMRFSINCLAWKGSSIARISGKVAPDEEPDIATNIPNRLGLNCWIATNTLACHFAFFTQRLHMDATCFLDAYLALAPSKTI